MMEYWVQKDPLIPPFHYSKIPVLLQPSFFFEPVEDSLHFRQRLSGGLFPFQDRLVLLGKIAGADMAHFRLYDYVGLGALDGPKP